MSSIQIKSSITLEELIQGVTQLEGEELDRLIREVLSIRARRNLSNLEKRESELLELINESIPAETWERFQELNEKREAENLSDEENKELIGITTEMEARNVQRIQYLSELALLRHTDLRTLMQELGIPEFHN